MADPDVVTTKRARPKLGHSAQAKWQKKQQELGNCRACGGSRPPELKQLCRACQTKTNDYMKRYRTAKRAAKKETTDAASPDTKAPADAS